MNSHEEQKPLRMLVLISTHKLAEKAIKLFEKSGVPVQYRLEAEGTAPSETMDMLGIGSTEKSVIAAMMPKSSAEEMNIKIHKELKLGSVNSGIAFSVPITGGSNLIIRLINAMNSPENERKDEAHMSENGYSVIAAVVNQGFTEAVMNAARTAGAGGGTVFHSRRIASEETVKFRGLSLQDERETVLILAANPDKVKIMQAISEKCGIRSEAEGIVLSLPVDSVIGLD